MKAKRKTNTLAIVIFVGFVAVTGFMFVQAGYFENPFGFVQLIAKASQGGSQERLRDGSGSRSGSGEGQQTRGTGADSGEKDVTARNQIDWSQFGHVLFNIWFLFAAAAFVMVVQIPLGFVFRRIRQVR